MSYDGLVDANETRHVVTVDGLTPGVKYGYRIEATEIKQFKPYSVLYGDTAGLDRINDLPLSFTTLDPAKPCCSFSVVSDIHENAGRLETMLGQVPWDSTDLLVMNGDMLNHFETEEQIFRGFLDVCVSRFAATRPFLIVRGNHETRGLMARQLKGYFPASEDRYFYRLKQGPVSFLVLDSGEDKADGNIEYSGLVDFDRYRVAERDWLEKAVADPGFQQSAYKVVLIHMPLFGGNNWHGEKKNREWFLPILNQAGIDLALSGHTHSYARINAGQHENRFPIIIGDPQNVINVEATPEGMNIVVKNADGSVKDQVRLPRKTADKS